MAQGSTVRRSSGVQRDVRALLLLDAGIEAISAAALTAAALAIPRPGAWRTPGAITPARLGIAATGFAGAAITLAMSANRIGHVEVDRIPIPLALLGLGNAAAATGVGAWGAIGSGLGGGVRTVLVASGIFVATLGSAQARLARKIRRAHR